MNPARVGGVYCQSCAAVKALAKRKTPVDAKELIEKLLPRLTERGRQNIKYKDTAAPVITVNSGPPDVPWESMVWLVDTDECTIHTYTTGTE